MPRTIQIEMLDGESIELSTSMAALLRVEEQFGCKWQEAFKMLGDDPDPQTIANLAAALSDEEPSYILENFDLLAMNDMAERMNSLMGVDAEDIEKYQSGARKKSTRSSGVRGKPRPRQKNKTAKKAPRKKKPG